MGRGREGGRRALVVALVGAVAVGGLPAAGVAASPGGSVMACHGAWAVRFTPGMGMAPGRSDFQTPPATVGCSGDVRGQRVTGPGTFRQAGTLEGTVLSGTGRGTQWMTLPTAGGPVDIAVPYSLSYGPGIGFKAGDLLPGETFLFHPSEGNGVTAPVTEIRVVAFMSIRT